MVSPGCGVGTYVVFFDWNDAAIRFEAAAILDGAIQNWRGCMDGRMLVSGFADRSGGAPNNQRISRRRAIAVEGYLAAHGISAAAIQIDAKGETEPRVATADGVREVQNRRVEITFAWPQGAGPVSDYPPEPAGNPTPDVTP